MPFVTKSADTDIEINKDVSIENNNADFIDFINFVVSISFFPVHLDLLFDSLIFCVALPQTGHS